MRGFGPRWTVPRAHSGFCHLPEMSNGHEPSLPWTPVHGNLAPKTMVTITMTRTMARTTTTATMKLSEEKGKHQIVFGDSEINEAQEKIKNKKK